MDTHQFVTPHEVGVIDAVGDQKKGGVDSFVIENRCYRVVIFCKTVIGRDGKGVFKTTAVFHDIQRFVERNDSIFIFETPDLFSENRRRDAFVFEVERRGRFGYHVVKHDSIAAHTDSVRSVFRVPKPGFQNITPIRARPARRSGIR